ncbi:tail assembly protein [Serratia marcescens]|uniref:tail assembly protein n=1 Tax=Serratia TaxID=613 RepID=UPI0013B5BCDC|nr:MULTISPECIES: tail assembly protein [Serratia]MBF4187697.1 tail assembly protein [Serratia ureilytica]MBF8442905.1 tail assembly protein [Serratia ureilytica]MBF8447662.1 tail assembly protein [Serratia ureilytica]NDY44792.1 tail assembly protein [Serratia marcescens]NDY49535.1 tail assembly protein [Serratia marcescens]
MLKKITLKGAMGKKFGRHHEYAVVDLREALRAMCTTIPGFKKYMSTAHIDGIRFAFFSGRENIGIEEFDMAKGADEFVIMPIIEGAKRGGVLQVVIGAVALVAAFFTAGASMAAWGAALSAGAMSATTVLTGIGISMMLGGVVQLLTPQPSMNVGASSSTDNKPNYAFGAPVNTVAMGYPVPVLYGEREIGGAIISAGIFSSDQQ